MGNFETDISALMNIGKKQLPENTKQLRAQNALKLLELHEKGYKLSDTVIQKLHAIALEAVLEPYIKTGFFR